MIVPGTLSLHRLLHGDASVTLIVIASAELQHSNGWRSALAGTLDASDGVGQFNAISHWYVDPVQDRELVQP